jgi:Carboxypeptidase regulatory-like domain
LDGKTSQGGSTTATYFHSFHQLMVHISIMSKVWPIACIPVTTVIKIVTEIHKSGTNPPHAWTDGKIYPNRLSHDVEAMYSKLFRGAIKMERFLSAVRKTVIVVSLMGLAAINLPFAHSQAISTNGGSIQGTVTDPSNAVIPHATVIIADPATGYSHTLVTDSAGFYSLGPLTPGTYTISITVPNFAHEVITTVVETGTATNGSARLSLGSQNETIEVNAGVVQVNTDQIGVAGVVTQEQIDTLPINGRNILDIAQVQPGVILQSGQTFDPTKTGYSALSINGENGRTTRILVDGQDISDETVGTTLFNVPSGAIGEFQLNRSTQDVSGSVTSTGQVLLATQSGTNRYHGNAFYNFQDARAGFANVNGLPAPFQRNQFGGYVGGYIIKDKLFFFGGSERIKQADSSPASNNAHFQAIINQFKTIPDPFHDTFSIGRLDYNGPWGVHFFARATYSVNAGFGTSGLNPYSLFENQDNIPALVGGADFTTGKFTHSVRFGYIKFINALHDGTAALGSSIYNPSSLFGFPVEFVGGIDAGGNENAPQKTFQSSKQFRYDGTWTKGAHNIKYGGEVTRILEGGFAAFYGASLVTDVSTNTRFLLPTCATATPVGGLDPGATTCSDDPLYGYKPAEYIYGNGNGSFSERPAFGLPGGGQFSWRMAAYVGDTWKVKPSITIVAGLRWSVDTDRANQDVPTPTCGEVDPSLQFSGCDSTTPNTPLFDFYGPGEGLGRKTQQNYANFGPQAGFVYSPGSHRLAVRGGAGIYYENDLFNNGGNARSEVITAEGQYFGDGAAIYNSPSINLAGFPTVNGLTNTGAPCTPPGAGAPPNGCNTIGQVFALPVAQATPIFNGLKTLYQAASKVNQPNTSFIGTGGKLDAANIYAGPYKTPYSIQVNGGVQYELKKGLVVSADFIHNATLKVPITVDTNHVGAARYLNTAAAKNAIAVTATSFGCTATTGAAAIDCVIANGGVIDDFAGNGLDSGNDLYGGTPASANGATPNTGAAFPGANPNVGTGDFILPVGKSAYDALQIVVQQQKSHPLPGLVSSNMQISYNLSRAISNSSGGSNQFFAGSGAYDQDCVNCNFGRNGEDHTNQISVSGSTTIKHGLQVGLVGHFFSAPPSTLTLGGITGIGIFNSDVDGDGTTNDLLPGTKPGYYMHQVSRRGLQGVINNYNATQAGTLTPAGRALVDNNLFTQAELVELNAVKQPLLPAPANPLGNAATRTFDASIKYPITYMKRFREGLVLTPGVTMYNVTNMSNYGGFSALAPASAATNPSSTNGDLNGPNNQGILNTARVNRGTGNGTYDQGGPRTTEFSLKLDF